MGSLDLREVGRIVCKGIVDTTRTVTAERCVHVALFPCWPAATQKMEAGWGPRDGLSNVLWLGFINFVAFGFGTSVGQISMNRS